MCADRHLFAASINLLSLYVESNTNSQPKWVYCQLVITDAHYAVAAFAFQDLQQQTFYSVLDQLYHGPHPLPGPSTTSVLIGVQERYSSVPYVRDTVQSLPLLPVSPAPPPSTCPVCSPFLEEAWMFLGPRLR